MGAGSDHTWHTVMDYCAIIYGSRP